MKLQRFALLIILCFLIPAVFVFAGQDAEIFSQGRRAAQSGKPDFAFMYYRSIVNDHPGSRYEKDALFAVGEYLFLLPDYREAYKTFETYTRKFPGTNGYLFALASMLKIARLQHKDELAQELESRIIQIKPVSFVFRNSKEANYQSSLARKWKAIFQINRIEFFVGGEPFEKISY